MFTKKKQIQGNLFYFNLKMYIVHSTQEKQLQNENIIEYIRIERENF